MFRIVNALAFAACLSAPGLVGAQSLNYVQPPNLPQAQTQTYGQVPANGTQPQSPYRRSSRAGYGVVAAPAPAPAATQVNTDPRMPPQGQRAMAPMTGRYPTADAARGACSGDQVVWANTSTKVYHMSDSTYFGKTKHGAFMCEKAADSGGFHASKGG